MTWEIRRIPLLALIKVSFIVYLFLSLIIMLLYGLFLGSMAGLIGEMIGDELDLGALTGGALVIGGLIGSVVLASIYTFITFVGALIYNAVASLVGGLEVELESREVMVPGPGYAQPQQVQPVVQQPVPATAPVPQAAPAAPPPAETSGDVDRASDQSENHERFKPKGSSDDWGWKQGD